MKYLNKMNICILAALFLLPVACEDPLKERPFDSVSTDDFYQTEQQFQLALNAVYANLWTAYAYKDNNNTRWNDQVTDILHSRSTTSSSNVDKWVWSRTTRAFNDWWRDVYGPIGNANKILAALEEADLSQAANDQIEGETRFLRAFWYYNLVKMFKGVPIVTEPTESIPEDFKPRNTMEETWSFIEDDLTQAEQLLSPFDVNDHNVGKATAASAQGLLARVHAWQREWQDAADAADRALSHSEIRLEEDFRLIWDPDNENTEEHLFSIAHGVGNSTSNIGNHRIWQMTLKGFTAEIDGENKSVRFAFNENDKGSNFYVKPSFFNTLSDTYRRKVSIVESMPYFIVDGEVRDEEISWADNPNVWPGMIRHHFTDGNFNQVTTVNDNVLRTAEMYLIKAEALNELGYPNQDAFDAINMVRARARGDNLPASKSDMAVGTDVYEDLDQSNTGSQDEFRQKIIEEFAREHIGEGLFRGVLLRHDQYVSRSKEKGEAEDAAEHKRFFPIPDVQMERNTKLEQNEGYTSGGNG